MQDISRHPKGLYVLFFTEMWERFCYYLMIAIFAYYMDEFYSMPKSQSGQIYGLFIAFVYFTPIFGGLLADRALGYVKTIMMGAVCMGLGYFLLAVPNINFFYVSLIVIAAGNGLFKPNISTLVGNLYPDGSGLKDRAFAIFYMGINIGALISPFAAAYLRSNYGWKWAFGAAGAGMFVALLIISIFKKHVKYADIKGGTRKERETERIEVSKAAKMIMFLMMFLTFGFFFIAIITKETAWKYIGYSGSVIFLVGTIAYLFKKYVREEEKQRVGALLTIFVIVIIFWAGFHQNGYALAFWARDCTDLAALPKFLQNPEIQGAINPFFVIFLTPLLVLLWGFLAKRKMEPTTPAKIGWGMIITAVSFAIMAAGAIKFANVGRVSPSWLIWSYFVITLAELCLSPMGLSYCNKVAPYRMRGMIMGGWFGATAIGNYLSGAMGAFWDKWSHANFFWLLTFASLFGALLLKLFLKRLKRATGDM